MNYVLGFRPEVWDELSDTYSWYESQKIGLGDEFIDCVDDLLNRIRTMPEAYTIVYRVFAELLSSGSPTPSTTELYLVESLLLLSFMVGATQNHGRHAGDEL